MQKQSKSGCTRNSCGNPVKLRKRNVSLEKRRKRSCSREKLRSVLANLEADDLESTIEDGVVKVTCEFCSTTYRFEASEVQPQERASVRTS